MWTKNQVKYLRSLQQKKFRQLHQQYVVEGVKSAHEWLTHAPQQIAQIYATEEWEAPQTLPIEPIRLPLKALKQVSSLKNPNQVLLVINMKAPQESAAVIQSDISLILDGVRDPGNLGTIIRIADWFNIRHIFCTEDCVEVYNPKVIQACMGSLLRVQVHYEAPDALLARYPDTPVFAATLEGDSLFAHPQKITGFLALGSESHGLRHPLLQEKAHALQFPRYGGAESLNVAVATALFCGFIRQNA